MIAIESDGHNKVADYPQMIGEICNACGQHLEVDDSFESLVDRVSRRSYLLHTGSNCWSLFETKLKGEEYGNVPAWAQL